MDERLERYAELVVRIGINVQPGQEVFLYRPSSTTSWREPSRPSRRGPSTLRDSRSGWKG
jgi:Thermophilic metalloprotease (M29)